MLPQKRGPYRIEDWGKTWLNPNKERVLARVPAVAMPDIAGYWPQTTRRSEGRRSMPSASSICSTSFPISVLSRSSTRPTATSCSFAGSPEEPVRRGRSKRSDVTTSGLEASAYLFRPLLQDGR
jgi:hypothetical protein